MKKIIFTLVIIFTFSLLASQVFALDLGSGLLNDAGKKGGYDTNTDQYTLAKNIGIAVNIILSIIGVLFTILMVYAGYTWMLARGDEGKVDKAKDIIKASIIGLVITLAAYSITNFIIPRILERTLS
ncbi:MAG: hypothetical protein WC070_02590 [Candidatus Magasanikbacteria bacterium]